MPILAILFMRTRGGGVRLWASRGSVLGMQGDGSTTKLDGIVKMTMLAFDLAWVYCATMLLWLWAMKVGVLILCKVVIHGT